MSRQLKFRGKRVDNSKWVYGLPLYSVVDGKTIIDTIQSYEDLCFYTVIPETIGQYTGLRDKNGKEIYEGDIVRTADGNVVATIKTGECYQPLCRNCNSKKWAHENPELMEGTNND